MSAFDCDYRKGFPVSQALLQALQNPALYPHPVEAFTLIETHISWVLLTGPFAYKIKKPVDFGFLNFTALADREHFCREELRLNQRLTQDLYLDVLPITGSSDAPELGGNGEAFEFVLKMKQFPQAQLLDRLLAAEQLTSQHITQLAEQIARFHLNTPHVPADQPFGSPDVVMEPVRQNFEQVRGFLEAPADLRQLEQLAAWAEDSFTRLQPVLAARKANGFVRECHGDIHLANAAVIDGQVALFDCIEFNQPFRCTDVMADIAFLIMDLQDRQQHAAANSLLSQYLEITGDYAGLAVLPFYTAYRAMVRAKIALFGLAHAANDAERAQGFARYRSYANLAESYSAIPSRFVAITHGVSGVGKSTVSLQLVSELGAIRVRSDVERKRLLGEQPASQQDALGQGIYSAQASEQTYRHIHQLAEQILQAGFSPLLDATYLKHAQRQAACDLAEEHATPFLILDCQAPDEQIAQWLEERRQAGDDPSDASLEVMRAQQASREPLSQEEQQHAKFINTHDSHSVASLIGRIRQRFPSL
nr:bifunctional aminoglycoside phosphotransferase/ATP-binding protein [Atopomonas sediminilitoris]